MIAWEVAAESLTPAKASQWQVSGAKSAGQVIMLYAPVPGLTELQERVEERHKQCSSTCSSSSRQCSNLQQSIKSMYLLHVKLGDTICNMLYGSPL